MVGTAFQYSNGDISQQDVEDLILKPDKKPSFIRGLAKAEGLVMKECKFKEGNLFKEPIFIEEEFFLRNYKEKLRKMGIDYVNPNDENVDDDYDGDVFGGMFE